MASILQMRGPATVQNHPEHIGPSAIHARVSTAQQDYDRLRDAFMGVLRADPNDEVALALLGADLDRAHAVLQNLLGVQPPAGTMLPSRLLRRHPHWGTGWEDLS